MAHTQQQLKQAVMGRVYTAYAMRRVFRSSTIRAALSVGSLVSIFSFVSVLSVLKNFAVASTSGGAYEFAVSAFAHAGGAVLLSCALLAAAAAWYAADLIKGSAAPLNSRI